MVSWNDPTVTTDKAQVLVDLKARDENVAKLDYTGDSNLPTGAFQMNSAQYLETWSGSVFEHHELRMKRENMAAAGANQAAATLITVDMPVVSSGSGGVRLPDVAGGEQVTIWNNSGGDVNVYPFLADAFLGETTNDPIVLGEQKSLTFRGVSASRWAVVGDSDYSPNAYQTWTPTYGVSGGTFTGTSTVFARYATEGNSVIGDIRFTGTAGSTADYVTFTAPVSVADTRVHVASSINGSGDLISCYTGSGTSIYRCFGDHLNGGVPDGSRTFYVNFFYEAA